jgi:hypothetical protein
MKRISVRPENGERRIRPTELAKCVTSDETCLARISDEGQVYLAHLEMDILDESGERIGSIRWDGEIPLPTTRFIAVNGEFERSNTDAKTE